MEKIEIKNFSFTYPDTDKKALSNISLSVQEGEFITICGKSGCGKTTLLRSLKPSLSPFGKTEGEIFCEGIPVGELSQRDECKKIGFVMQNPDNQIVTDKVWHELAFGLENLGYKTDEIQMRVAEMASYFGIEDWFYNNVYELSGGQKQLLNLASVMVMGPDILVLDEPSSQLDPITAKNFLNILSKINKELGITIILSEHRLEECFTLSDRVIVMENGEIIADDTPKKVAVGLKNSENDMMLAMPVVMRCYADLENGCDYPVNIKEGRLWLARYKKTHKPDKRHTPDTSIKKNKPVVDIKDAYFKYEKDSKYIISGLSLRLCEGEIYCVLGGNGAGKTTLLMLICNNIKAQRGIVRIKDKTLGVIPQNPETLFVKKTVWEDLEEMLLDSDITKEEKMRKINDAVSLCKIGNLLKQHPYDLSGGERQRVALAKILLKEPQILLLDEPTKCIDAHFREEFAKILTDLRKKGKTIFMVSHDIEFCAKVSDRCSMMFGGKIIGEANAREFFCDKQFYTTSANRLTRGIICDALLFEDVINTFSEE